MSRCFGAATEVRQPLEGRTSPMSCARAERVFGYTREFVWSTTRQHPDSDCGSHDARSTGPRSPVHPTPSGSCDLIQNTERGTSRLLIKPGWAIRSGPRPRRRPSTFWTDGRRVCSPLSADWRLPNERTVDDNQLCGKANQEGRGSRMGKRCSSKAPCQVGV